MAKRKKRPPEPHPIVKQRLELAIANKERHLGSGALLRKRDMPEGVRFCRWCGGEPPKGRRTWCSEACVSEYLIRSSGSSARHYVEKRDRGICSVCGIPAKEVEELLRRTKWTKKDILPEGYLAQWGAWWTWNRTCWEADHIVPVIEGGGCCGLSNLRTLCLMCHKNETKELAGRRAQAERERKTGQQEFRL